LKGKKNGNKAKSRIAFVRKLILKSLVVRKGQKKPEKAKECAEAQKGGCGNGRVKQRPRQIYTCYCPQR
jgi:hypothetical protein